MPPLSAASGIRNFGIGVGSRTRKDVIPPMAATHRVVRGPISVPRKPPSERAERPRAVVHRLERAGHPGPYVVRNDRGEDGADGDVQHHHAEAADELGHHQDGQDQHVRAAGGRHRASGAAKMRNEIA